MTMNANRRWAACRCWLSGALCALLLIAALFPAHAGAVSALRNTVLVSSQVTDDQLPLEQRTMPGHVGTQCVCGIAVLSEIAAPIRYSHIAFVQFDISDTSLLHLMPPDPPSKPPRT